MFGTSSSRAGKSLLVRLRATMRVLLKGIARRSPSAVSRSTSPADEVAASAAFDDHFYAAQSGQEFDSRGAAATHFIEVGMRDGAQMHPLLEQSYFPRAVAQAYAKGQVAPVMAFLQSGASARRRVGTLLDARRVEVIPDRAIRSAEDLVEWLGDDRPLTVSAQHIGPVRTLGEIRPDLERIVADLRTERQGLPPRSGATWDEDAERRWRGTATGASTNPPTVDIVLAVRDGESTIASAIDSVLVQTFQRWVLWIVDAGSLDRTRAIVDERAARDPRIRVVDHDGSGLSAARAAALRHATGAVTAFLEPASIWRPDFLDLAVGALEPGDEDWVHAGSRHDDGHGNVDHRGPAASVESLLVRPHVGLDTVVVRRSVLDEVGGFDPDLRSHEDHDLVLKLALRSGPHFLPFIGCDRDGSARPSWVTGQESPAWEAVVLGRHQLDRIDPPCVVPGRWSVVVSSGDRDTTRQNLRSVFDAVDADGVDAEVVVLDHGSTPADAFSLRVAVASEPRVRVVRASRRYSAAMTWSMGRRHASGEYLFVLPAGAWIRRGVVGALGAVFADQDVVAVQPIVVDSAGSLVTAGLHCIAGQPRPVAVVQGVSPESVAAIDGVHVDALSGGAIVVRSAAWDAAGGPDLSYSGDAALQDLGLRLRSRGLLRLAASAVVTLGVNDNAPLDPWSEGDSSSLSERWAGEGVATSDAAALLAPMGLRPAGSAVRVLDGMWTRVVVPAPLLTAVTDRPDRLRWSIKIGARNTPSQDGWGDVPYAADLAAALRRLGQDVSVVRADQFVSAAAHLEDVVVAIRGATAVPVVPGTRHLMWILSAPETIESQDLAAADHVFVASDTWVEVARRQVGRRASVLHHGTDPTRFHPDRRYAGGPDISFVGSHRPPVGRQVVQDVIAAGGDVKVWGPNWDRFLSAARVGGSWMPPERLGELYASSRIVLTDHYQTMADNGFINNRTFDAVASGARVISDHVEGLDTCFSGAVQTYSSIGELRALLSPTGGMFPDDAEMEQISRRVRQDFSFDHCAGVLLDVARTTTPRARADDR